MELGTTCYDDRIKIRVFGTYQELTPDQTWSNLPKFFEKLGYDVKLWKVMFWGDFDIVWLSANLGFTKGVLVILAKKRYFECSGVRTSWATSFYMFSWPHGENMIFLNFSGSGTQIEGRQNTVSTWIFLTQDFVFLNYV